MIFWRGEFEGNNRIVFCTYPNIIQFFYPNTNEVLENINSSLEVIMSSPKESSNPYDYQG